jgi:hypothetical protein
MGGEQRLKDLKEPYLYNPTLYLGNGDGGGRRN